jgi:hypothetical protein
MVNGQLARRVWLFTVNPSGTWESVGTHPVSTLTALGTGDGAPSKETAKLASFRGCFVEVLLRFFASLRLQGSQSVLNRHEVCYGSPSADIPNGKLVRSGANRPTQRSFSDASLLDL